MPSSSPDSSPADRPAVVVAALSARALAQAASLAGYRVAALDLFGDQDTGAVAAEARALPGSIDLGLEAGPLLRALDDLIAAFAGALTGLVYGAGFEDRPDLLAAIAERLPLIGNAPETVRRVKDPRTFFRALERLGLAFPEISLDRPEPGAGWLAKRIGGSGGGHIASDPGSCEHYFQRRVGGRPVSALFLADGNAAEIIGFSEQWSSPAENGGCFRYGGAAQPARLAVRHRREIEAGVAGLVPAFGLIGLNSADFLVRDRDLDLLEVNPRPGGTLDVFESGRLFARHCGACLGEPIGPSSGRLARAGVSDQARAVAVVYAPEALTVPAGFSWPSWAADLPATGWSIERDAPLCSVLAQAPSADQARDAVMARRAEILASLLRRPEAPQAEAGEAVA